MGTNFSYDDTSHQVIFDHINGGAGSDALQETSRSWQQLGAGVGTTCKSFVQTSIGVILSSRQGAAADGAAAATGAMLPWMDTVVQTTTTVAQRAQEQAEHWVTAKNSVPPVPSTPKSAGFSSDPGEWAAEKMDWFPGITSDEERAQLRQQDAAEQARHAMRVYQSNSNGNVDVAPTFTPPQALDGTVGALPLSDPRVDTAPTPTPGMTGDGTPAHLLSAHHPATSQPAVHQPPVQPTTYQPAATVSQLAGGAPAGTASTTHLPDQGVAEPTPVQGLGAMTVGSGVAEGTAAGRGRPGSARGGATGAGRGAGHATGFGPRPTSFGPRPTPSTHTFPEEISGARGSTGSPGATRSGGYGEPVGSAGANQHREEDREHRSKYLIYTDSNAIVGDLPPTAPPVIGADY
ncbi:MAG: PPE domain-containing protein [Pseudonocardiaceae bacterium]